MSAVESHRRECSAAIRYAADRHGEVEGRAWGSWKATPGYDYVDVTYTPHTGNDHYRDKWGERGYWRVYLRDLEPATV